MIWAWSVSAPKCAYRARQNSPHEPAVSAWPLRGPAQKMSGTAAPRRSPFCAWSLGGAAVPGAKVREAQVVTIAKSGDHTGHTAQARSLPRASRSLRQICSEIWRGREQQCEGRSPVSRTVQPLGLRLASQSTGARRWSAEGQRCIRCRLSSDFGMQPGGGFRLVPDGGFCD